MDTTVTQSLRKNFLQPNKFNALKKREDFAVSLRKEKRQGILKSKRKEIHNHNVLKKLNLESGDPIVYINKFLMENKVVSQIDHENEKTMILVHQIKTLIRLIKYNYTQRFVKVN